MTSRRLLRAVIGLGLVISLMSGVGVFAVFSDTATTNTNTADSGTLASAAYLRIATATKATAVSCGTFQDDLALPLIAVQDLQADDQQVSAVYFCLRNAGSATLTPTWTAKDLVDVEIACTGDEATVDQTCTPGAAGELSANLRIYLYNVNCATGAEPEMISATLPGLAASPAPFQGGVTIAPGAQICAKLSITCESGAGLEAIQAAQSDRATWRFAFTGTAL